MPALANTFLFVEPDDNYLDYGSTVLTSLVAANRQASQNITEIKGMDATPSNVKNQLATLNPMVFAAIGHGNTETYTVEAEAIFMLVGATSGDAYYNNISSMNNRVVHLNSCETAVSLGPAIISAGAIAYVGSNQDFNFCIVDPPNSSRVVQTVFLAEYQFDVSLLKGKSVGDARTDQLAKYDSEITYWLEGAGNTDPNASDLANMLLGNKNISVFLGQGTVTPSPAGGIGAFMGVSVPAPLLFGLASIALGYAIYRTLFT